MDFQITSRHLELTDGLKTHAEQVADRLGQEFENITSIRLILSVEKHLHISRFEVRISGGEAQATDKSPDMYNSIDGAMKKVESQLRKEQKRRSNPKRRTSIAKDIPVSMDESEADEEEYSR
jgi:putative sigma-54 modulation protein